MSIKARFIIYFGLILLIVGATGGYFIWITNSVDKYIEVQLPKAIGDVQKSSKLDITAQLIRYDDEVLTQSVRNYAYTRDVKWKTRYNEYVPKLDLRISEAIESGDDNDRKIFSDINAANLALIDLETKAIAFVDSGDSVSAQRILNSDEYAKQKEIYATGVTDYLSRQGANFDSAFAVTTDTLDQAKNDIHQKVHLQSTLIIGFIGLLLVVFIFVILLIIKTFMIPLNVFRKSAKDITAGNMDTFVAIKARDEIGDFADDFNKMTKTLKDLYENLEEKVNERTTELQKFKLAVEYASDHIVITDPKGIVLYANSGAERITGFSGTEILGKKAGSKELWGGIMDQDFYKKLWKTISVDKKVFIGEVENHRKNGEKYIALASISPVLGDKNEVLFYVGIERDVTKEKELEKAKDEFVSIASHELRTPMTAIKGFVSMILEGDYGKVDKEIQDPLNNIRVSTERLIHLVNDMLNLSRIEAGRLKITLEGIDSAKAVQETVDSLAPLAEERKLVLKSGKLSSANVQADSDKLRQILTNLIGNSLKFTDKGEIVVEQQIDGNFAKISVKDTGIGIPESEKDRVFGKFEQIHDNKKGRPQGTGLGLYICKMLVEKMGGKMWLEYSEVGKGSVFSFTLPLSDSKEAKVTKELIIKEAGKVNDQKEMEPMAQV